LVVVNVKFSPFTDSHVDCGVKGEDEIGCELTAIEIENIEKECELKKDHAMCPYTLLCIKQQWFCGKLSLFVVQLKTGRKKN